MVNFLGYLPGYQAPGPLNFSPITQAIESNQQNALAREKNVLARDQYDLHRRQVENQLSRQAESDARWNALRNDPSAIEALGPVAPYILAAGPEHGPQSAVSTFNNRYTTDAQRGLRSSQEEEHRARARYYWQRANIDGMVQPTSGPLDGWGLDSNGALVPVGGRSESMVLGRSDSIPDGATREHADFGPAGRLTNTVPGVVVTDKGAVSPEATRAARGQAQMDAPETPEAARNRLLQAKRNQEVFGYVFGKPPPGKAWDNNGKLVPLERKESVTDRQSLVIAEQGMRALDEAERILRRSGTIAQIFGDDWKIPGTDTNVGGWGEAGRGFRGAKAAVIDLNFSLSGKSVSNAERTEFLNLYMPRSTDSTATQQWKIGRMRAFFDNIMRARKTGATDDEVAGIYSSAIADGVRGADDPRAPAVKDQSRVPQPYDPATRRQVPGQDDRTQKFKSKYQGLE